jgi:hypothetical protein
MAQDHVECATPLERYFRRTEAAKYITEDYFPCSRIWLAKLACVSSDGPPFTRLVGSRSILSPTLTIGRKARSGRSFDLPPKFAARFPSCQMKTSGTIRLAGSVAHAGHGRRNFR